MVRYIKQNGIDSTDVSHTLLLGFALDSIFLCRYYFKHTKLAHKRTHFYES